jgi:hypothetical protein
MSESGYYPVVVSPGVRPQTSDHQPPFYFGGSQVPFDLGMVGRGVKGTTSLTNKGDLNFTTKKGDKMFHRGGKDFKVYGKVPYMRK